MHLVKKMLSSDVYDADPEYDFRDWALEYEKMGNGITLSADEVQELYKILINIVEG